MKQVIENAIAAAAEELNVNYQDEAAWYTVLIQQCMSTFKSHQMISPYRKMELEIYQNKATIPTGINFIGITKLGPIDSELSYCPDVEYVVQGNVIIFDESLNLEDGDKVMLTYKAWRTNIFANDEIQSRFERMFVAYIGWKHCRRYNTDPNYPAWKMNDYKQEYLALKKGLM